MSSLIRATRTEVANLGVSTQSEAATVGRLGGWPADAPADVERLIADAETLLSEGKHARGGKLLERARDSLLPLPPSDARWVLLRDVQILFAWSEFKLGRHDGAEAALWRVFPVDPSYQPDPARFPPSFMRYVAEVASRVRASSTIRLAITTDPVGVPVFVDGRLIGHSPTELAVPPGERRIEAGFATSSGAARVVQVYRTQVIHLDAKVEGAVFRERGPCIVTSPHGREEILLRVARILGVEELVTLVSSSGDGAVKISGLMLDASRGRVVRAATSTADTSSATASALAIYLVTGEAKPHLQLQLERSSRVLVAGGLHVGAGFIGSPSSASRPASRASFGLDASAGFLLRPAVQLGPALHLAYSPDVSFRSAIGTLDDGTAATGRVFENALLVAAGAAVTYRTRTMGPIHPLLRLFVAIGWLHHLNTELIPDNSDVAIPNRPSSEFGPTAQLYVGGEYPMTKRVAATAGIRLGRMFSSRGITQVNVPFGVAAAF